jgi:hypothetical protein
MADQTSTTDITVKIDLDTVVDSQRAIDLFARILRAVREQSIEDERKKQESGATAA